MEIITFKDKMWHEIPQLDNPAFVYLKSDPSERHNTCLIISKVQPYRAKSVGNNGYQVAYVPFTGDVISIGLFWNLESAELFAKAVSENEEYIDGIVDRSES